MVTHSHGYKVMVTQGHVVGVMVRVMARSWVQGHGWGHGFGGHGWVMIVSH